jgi:hypothetical protein
MLMERRLAEVAILRAMAPKGEMTRGRNPSHPRKSGYLRRATPEKKSESAQAFHFSRMRATSDHSRDRAGAWGEVEGDARSYGVPVNIVECKKLQE